MSVVEVRDGVGRFVRRALAIGPGECNLCHSRVRFAGIGGNLAGTLSTYGFPFTVDDFETLNHRHYACPVCGSADRDRLYHLYLDRFLPQDGTRRVLDFAPSRALSAYLRGRPDVDYRSADLMMAGVDDVVDITDMCGYADESFDFFVCSHVLEHVSDDGRALGELYRVLAPGGSGIVMTPIAPEGSFDEDPAITEEAERWRRFAQGDHVRLYDRSTLCARIRLSGFEVAALDVQTFGQESFDRHGIASGSVLYVVHKPWS